LYNQADEPDVRNYAV